MHAPILSGPMLCIVKKSHLLRLQYETFKTENASIKVAPVIAFACFMAMFHEQSLITGSHAVFLLQDHCFIHCTDGLCSLSSGFYLRCFMPGPKSYYLENTHILL